MPRLAVNAEAEEAAPSGAASAARVKTPAKRSGVPVWRTGKPDAVLAAAMDVAREAVHSIANPSDVGSHIAARTEGDRVVTHLFECRMSGYPGWQWFAVLTRNSRSKVITVNEVGLLPSEDSVLAPEWVPWAERVRPEDARPDEAPEETPAEVREDTSPEGSPDPAAVVENDAIESVKHAELAADSDEDDAADAAGQTAADGIH